MAELADAICLYFGQMKLLNWNYSKEFENLTVEFISIFQHQFIVAAVFESRPVLHLKKNFLCAGSSMVEQRY